MTRACATLLPILWLAVIGCAEPLTQLILVVDSDVPLARPNPSIPVEADQLREISLSLFGPCDGSDCPPVFEDSAQQYNTPGGAMLPFSIGLLLDDPAQTGPYQADVHGLLGQGAEERLITVRAVFSFIPGESRVVPLYIVSSCLAQSCPMTESCGAGGTCESVLRRAEDLPLWSGELADFSLESR